jgi:polyphosphate kinase
MAMATRGTRTRKPEISLQSPQAFLNRELSWLGFARRVLALVEDESLPLLERVRFAGIMGMLHDEFFMKRMSGLKRQMKYKPTKISLDGRSPAKEFHDCQEEIITQMKILENAVDKSLRPTLADAGMAIRDHDQLSDVQKHELREYFQESVHPILTPLAVDAEHPFPFVSNHGLNLAILLPHDDGSETRFVRLKVPDNRPRWIPLQDGSGYIPLEQVIANNLDLLFGGIKPVAIHTFRVSRGAEGDTRDRDLEPLQEPGSIVRLVTSDLKARRFAGVVRLKVDKEMPDELRDWLVRQFEIDAEDVYPTSTLLGISDLLNFPAKGSSEHLYPSYTPVTHPRLRHLDTTDTGAIFEEIKRGDILLHHPYHSFDTSVLHLLEAAAQDPQVLAIKLTIYRTSGDSPIVAALAEAARRGKQVAVLVEITARFDEAPNIAWGKYLEKEGVHVSYGVESLKTHVKLALVLREEEGQICRYLHFGTGNYHTGTARIYEDLGVLTCDPQLGEEAAHVFNSLTGATTLTEYQNMLVAPVTMRKRFIKLIQREAEHAAAGRPAGIRAKMNQLQDAEIIRELYQASRQGVPITLVVRGLCNLRPQVPGLSETIRVFSVVGRYLEHSRIYCFENGGQPEYFIGSADWMKRNLNRRVETIVPIHDERIQQELGLILDVYDADNASAWDAQPGGSYKLRTPAEGVDRIAAQDVFMATAQTGSPAKLIRSTAKSAKKQYRRAAG